MYFLSMSKEEIQTLGVCALHVINFTIDGVRGVVFNQEILDDILRVTGRTYSSVPSVYDGIEIVTLLAPIITDIRDRNVCYNCGDYYLVEEGTDQDLCPNCRDETPVVEETLPPTVDEIIEELTPPVEEETPSTGGGVYGIEDEDAEYTCEMCGVSFIDNETDYGIEGFTPTPPIVCPNCRDETPVVEETLPPTVEEIIEELTPVEETPVEEEEDLSSITVWSSRWNGRSRDDFLKILREVLLPVVKKPIDLEVPHGDPCDINTNEGVFKIRVWSGPSGYCKRSRQAPARMWGTPTSCRDCDYVFDLSFGGFEIQSPEGDVVGECHPNCIYIYHDVVHNGNEYELHIFRQLITHAVVSFYYKTDEERTIYKKAIRQKLLEQSRVAYVAACSGRFSKALKNTEESIEKGKKEIDFHREKLIRRTREVSGAILKLEQMRRSSKDRDEEYTKEFDRLLSHSKVIDVAIRDGCIYVYTTNLYCLDDRDNTLYDIGKFEIRVSLNGDTLRWKNLTRRVNAFNSDMNAPHIYADGHACLGNMGEVIPELIANYEFSIAIGIMVEFAESVNTADIAGKEIVRWPKAPDHMQPKKEDI